MIGFIMSIVALNMTMRPATKHLTFGWHRAEVIGTLMSVIFLLCITIWLVVEATKRVVNPQKIESTTMLITAVMGLFFNLI
jgi:Co/Zn/Cd efflux system component